MNTTPAGGDAEHRNGVEGEPISTVHSGDQARRTPQRYESRRSEGADGSLDRNVSSRELIQKVHMHPALWDRSCSGYRNRDVKRNAWLEVCAELNPEFNQLTPSLRHEILLRTTKKWCNIRDSYRRTLKKGQKDYVYANSLNFLDATFRNLELDEESFDDIVEFNDSVTEHLENAVYLDLKDVKTESLSWFNLSSEQLIQKVSLYRTIWDRSCQYHKDKVKKQKAWFKICAELYPNFDKMDSTKKRQILLKTTKKWYNIRDSYVKYLKNKQKDKKEYVYANILSFLDSNYSNVEETLDEINIENDSNDDMSEHMENEVYLNFDEVNVPAEPSPKKRKIDLSNNDEEESNVITVLANLLNKEEDEDRAFFKSITPAVKKLSEDSKLQFRIELMNLISKLRKKDKKMIHLKVERVSVTDSDGFDE